VSAFLRAHGAPISVQKLARECPLPAGVPGKFIDMLASVERFDLQDRESARPMVQMRQTDREKWLSRCAVC